MRRSMSATMDPVRIVRPSSPLNVGRRRARCRLLTAALVTLSLPAVSPRGLAAQPLTQRTPNLPGAWVTSPRNLHFQFAHRFQVAGADVDISDIFGDGKIVNYPTFELAYGLFEGAMLGFRYSSNSLFAGQVNEWQPYLKLAPVRGVGDGALSLSLLAAWNEANESLDGELAVETRVGRLLLLGAVRGFTDLRDLPLAEGRKEEGVAVAGGAGVRLNRYLTLAGDVADLVGGPEGETAWSAGIHLGIPFTPHTFSIMATNVTSGTLAGSSRGIDGTVFWGFEFTVPFSGLARWGQIFDPDELPRAVAEGRAPPGARVVEVEISRFAFDRDELRVPVGTTVRWINRDPVAHTTTSDTGVWRSPLLGPGETFHTTFEEPGEYPYHCSPHPFMQGRVIVGTVGG